MEEMLQSIQHLADPPVDLNLVLRRYSRLRVNASSVRRIAGWLKANLQLSDGEVKRIVERFPAILVKSEVQARPVPFLSCMWQGDIPAELMAFSQQPCSQT